MPAWPSPLSQPHQPGSIADGWALLHEAGLAVAELAQLGPEAMPMSGEDFARRAIDAGEAREGLAIKAIDDCAAAMHYGLKALIAAREAGRDGTASALTLWREFDRARDGLLNLTTPYN